MICIELPLCVVTAVKKTHGKKYHINLNNFRNWHYHVCNNVKQTYQAEIKEQIEKLKFFFPIELKFVLHMGSKRRVDRANVLCMHEKYFCDALVENGCILDDCDKYIKRTIYETGEIDNKNPCVRVYITELD